MIMKSEISDHLNLNSDTQVMFIHIINLQHLLHLPWVGHNLLITLKW